MGEIRPNRTSVGLEQLRKDPTRGSEIVREVMGEIVREVVGEIVREVVGEIVREEVGRRAYKVQGFSSIIQNLDGFPQ